MVGALAVGGGRTSGCGSGTRTHSAPRRVDGRPNREHDEPDEQQPGLHIEVSLGVLSPPFELLQSPFDGWRPRVRLPRVRSDRSAHLSSHGLPRPDPGLPGHFEGSIVVDDDVACCSLIVEASARL